MMVSRRTCIAFGRRLTPSASRMRKGRPLAVATLTWLASGLVFSGCFDPPPVGRPAPGAIAFGVYGDGPYVPWEEPRFRRLLTDAEAAGLDFLIHIGDILGGACTDESLNGLKRRLAGVRIPVVYTPGDNEWADCHGPEAGGLRSAGAPGDAPPHLFRRSHVQPGRGPDGAHVAGRGRGIRRVPRARALDPRAPRLRHAARGRELQRD